LRSSLLNILRIAMLQVMQIFMQGIGMRIHGFRQLIEVNYIIFVKNKRFSSYTRLWKIYL